MIEIVKVDAVPTVRNPVEGEHYNVIEGAAAQGDRVRIRSAVGEHFQGCYTPHAEPAPAPLSWDAYDFKLRFTASERQAIRTAAKADAGVEDFLDMLDTAAATGTRIKADDALLNAGLQMMESAGLIGAGRAAAITGA